MIPTVDEAIDIHTSQQSTTHRGKRSQCYTTPAGEHPSAYPAVPLGRRHGEARSCSGQCKSRQCLCRPRAQGEEATQLRTGVNSLDSRPSWK